MAKRQGHVEAVTGMENLLHLIRQKGEDAEWLVVKTGHGAECKEEQGWLKYWGKIYVHKELRPSVIRTHHDH